MEQSMSYDRNPTLEMLFRRLGLSGLIDGLDLSYEPLERVF
jgi:hypothetical protein